MGGGRRRRPGSKAATPVGSRQGSRQGSPTKERQDFITAGNITEHYEFGHVLGRGGFSVVKAARPLVSNSTSTSGGKVEGEVGGDVGGGGGNGGGVVSGWVAVKQLTWVSDSWRNRPVGPYTSPLFGNIFE